MNRNILGFCVGLLVCAVAPLHAQQTSASTANSEPGHARVEQASADAGGLPEVAQAETSGAEIRSSSETEKNEVKDYKSFLKYADKKEQEALKAGEAPLREPGSIVKSEKDGIELSDNKLSGFNKAHTRIAALSSDGKGMIVIDEKAHKVTILDNKGNVVREGKYPKAEPPAIFSKTRLLALRAFDGPGGFNIYDYDGKLVSQVNPGFVDGCVVSNNQKYFAITAENQLGAFFILYDMDGNELWRLNILNGAVADVKFTRDDKYAVVKFPSYVVTDKNNPTAKESEKYRKLYIIDIAKHKIISEEDHEK